MKQASIFKSRRSLLFGMLGALIPLVASQAADAQIEPNWQRQGPSQTPSQSPPESTLPSGSQDSGTSSGQFGEESVPPTDPRGVQGPVRSDVTGPEPAAGESSESLEMQRRRDQEARDRETDERRRHMPPSFPGTNTTPDTRSTP